MSSFDPDDDRYKCCCGLFFAKRAVVWVSLGEIVLALAQFYPFFNPLCAALLLFSALCGFFALCRCDAKWMKANFYLHLVAVGAGLATGFMYIIVAVTVRSDSFYPPTMIYVGMVVIGVDFGLLAWFSSIVKTAAVHMRHGKEALPVVTTMCRNQLNHDTDKNSRSPVPDCECSDLNAFSKLNTSRR